MTKPARNWKIAALAVIVVMAAFFRFRLITEIPPGLYPDEAANGNNAVEAANTGTFKIFYPENNGREGLFINIQALSVKLFGPEPWALRIISALFGTLTVLGLYFLAKELFGKKSDLEFRISRSEIIALLSSFFLAVSYWHINFSRIGFRAIMVPFFAVFGMYWLLKALRTGKISSAILAGLSFGLGLNTYIAFRFMPFVALVPAAFSFLRWRRGQEDRRCIPCVVGLVLIAAFIAAAPIGLYFLSHPQDFFGRGGQVSIFSADEPFKEFVKSNVLTLGMFNVRGDCNSRHNLDCRPELFWPIGILFLIGLTLTIRELFRKPLSPIPYTLCVWFAFMMFPATLTREGLPHALRSIGLIPPTMIFAAVGGTELVTRLMDYFAAARENTLYAARRAQIGRIMTELVLLVLAIIAWLSFNAYTDYFVRFASNEATYGAFAADLWHAGKYLAAQPPQIKKFVIVNLAGDDIRGVPAPAQTVMFATDSFDAAKRSGQNIFYVRRPEDIAFNPGDKVIILPMNPRDDSTISALRARYPTLKVSAPADFVILEN